MKFQITFRYANVKSVSAPLTDLHAPIVRADANGGNEFLDGHLFGTKHQ
jgi:hypothetical protein